MGIRDADIVTPPRLRDDLAQHVVYGAGLALLVSLAALWLGQPPMRAGLWAMGAAAGAGAVWEALQQARKAGQVALEDWLATACGGAVVAWPLMAAA